MPKAKAPRRVLVVGGGPSGMEAARIAALRGHRVTLCEAQPQVGGALRLAGRAPKRHGLLDFVNWLEGELDHLGVEISTNAYMDAGDVRALAPDAVIVATGTTPRMDGHPIATPGEPIRGFERSNVVSVHDLLSAPDRDWGASAVVVDEIGHYEAIAAAECLIAKDLAVTFVTRHISFAPLLETTFTNVPSLQRLEQGDFQLRTRFRLVAVDDQGALIAPTYQPAGGNALERIAADTVVMAGINQPNRALHDELAASGIEARLVGEAATANFLGRAVHSGRLAGLQA